MKDLLLRLFINVVSSPAVALQRHSFSYGRLGAFPHPLKSIRHANVSHQCKVD
jgi:hypothetical protein